MSDGQYHAYLGALALSALVLAVSAARSRGRGSAERILFAVIAAGFLGYAGYLVVMAPRTVTVFYYAFAAPLVALIRLVRSRRVRRRASPPALLAYGDQPAPVPPPPGGFAAAAELFTPPPQPTEPEPPAADPGAYGSMPSGLAGLPAAGLPAPGRQMPPARPSGLAAPARPSGLPAARPSGLPAAGQELPAAWTSDLPGSVARHAEPNPAHGELTQQWAGPAPVPAHDVPAGPQPLYPYPRPAEPSWFAASRAAGDGQRAPGQPRHGRAEPDDPRWGHQNLPVYPEADGTGYRPVHGERHAGGTGYGDAAYPQAPGRHGYPEEKPADGQLHHG